MRELSAEIFQAATIDSVHHKLIDSVHYQSIDTRQEAVIERANQPSNNTIHPATVYHGIVHPTSIDTVRVMSIDTVHVTSINIVHLTSIDTIHPLSIGTFIMILFIRILFIPVLFIQILFIAHRYTIHHPSIDTEYRALIGSVHPGLMVIVHCSIVHHGIVHLMTETTCVEKKKVERLILKIDENEML